ncbi:MAG: Gfo/Idh/MocA family oxidoreductase [Paracoccaceae bacterium]|nr:Gfo/Idh/MocA family oxidoreductase [Paracoccaceae bacterium]
MTTSKIDDRPKVGIGLVGSGFMGRCQANAFATVAGLFDVPVLPVKTLLADATPSLAAKGARDLGFARATSDWQALIDDDAVDIVAITAPNTLHEPIALAAVSAGKTVYCEKPLSISSGSAQRMTDAAEAAGVVTSVAFGFIRNPMIRFARHLLHQGEIGEVTGFSGRHAENYMARPDAPHSFRTDPHGGGALADIGSHIICIARYLLGPIVEVIGDQTTIFPDRPVSAGASDKRPVEVDDMTHALLRFENGVSGSMEANWAAKGRTMDLSFEITGTNGAIRFSQERMNELLLYRDERSKSGYVRIEAGPDHPPYGQFCPAPGHHLGFNDLKVIEVADLLGSHSGATNPGPDFREALKVQMTVDAIAASSRTRNWTVVET